jgi:hypothetical protein
MSSSTFSIEDFSPYHLHHGDSPGTVLVSQLLDGDNYHTWSRPMVMALTAKNKLSFLNGDGDNYHTWSRPMVMNPVPITGLDSLQYHGFLMDFELCL